MKKIKSGHRKFMTGSVERFENKLSEFTGAPYVVTTDCCTHAIELCFRLLEIKETRFTAFTYISVPMTMRLLGVDYELSGTDWKDEYSFLGTPVWDSARCLKPKMYRQRQYQCLSFGPGKPLDNVRGGAILLDNEEHYRQLKMMSYDGRDPSYQNWIDQKIYKQGFHYMMRYEECESATLLLDNYISSGDFEHRYKPYPDVRDIEIR
jgi:dTDP-4-amino-4,6-dideoxygalactose transaminase